MKKQKIKVGDHVITKRFAEDEGYEDNDPDKLYFNGVMGECVNKIGIVENIDSYHIKVHGWIWPISKVVLVNSETKTTNSTEDLLKQIKQDAQLLREKIVELTDNYDVPILDIEKLSYVNNAICNLIGNL